MVEDEVRIEATTLEVSFKVQMFGRGATCATGQSDDLTRFHLVAHLYKVLRLMAVERLQSVGVLYDDAVAIAIIVDERVTTPSKAATISSLGFVLRSTPEWRRLPPYGLITLAPGSG